MKLAHKRKRFLFAILTIWLAMGMGSCQPTEHPPFSKQAVENPAGVGARLPRFTSLPGGGIIMSWVEPRVEGHVLKFAVHHQNRWIRQDEVAHEPDWFINWADFPSIVAIDRTFWVAHWLVNQPGGRPYDYDIALSISTDGGLTWGTPQSPHHDRSPAEHGFVSIFPLGGDAGIIWLDGREYHQQPAGTGAATTPGNFQLRSTRLHLDGRLDVEHVIDHNTCTCCGTSVVVTPAGPVAGWRSRTDKEIRDNRVAQFQNGQWSAPIPLGAEEWEIAGCPVNGPILAARGIQLAAVWFTGEGDRPRVRAAFSLDGGQHFGEPAEIDEIEP
ncbi:MAG TPA: exo-alpha-sialidase [Nitrospiraceae bacterium]|nr:exo-alpha-sialidase [Nitrospiraceae bacterium]